MANENVFSETPVEPKAVTVEDLVGEGRKYATVEDLAKAYANAEGFINELKSEAHSYKAKVETLEDIVKNRPSQEKAPEQRQNDPPEAPKPEEVDDRFKQLARETYEEISQTERTRRNQEAAADLMIEAYGNTEKANEAVRQKAAEMGVSVQWLQETAGRSPSAFEGLMGLSNRQTPRSDYTPKNDFVPRNPSGKKNEKTMSYYENLRKTDKNLYWARATQDELKKNAELQGEAFFDI